ncbi:MerR family transcriptional regulator [Anoxynatronum sibiricum]|uniref:MerR family transcriptional regulator n=1 Tax=Anoxynatronum sibiricum TaxID=210623 RepID=A0ABU9VWZ6_9CLOT
MYRTSDIASMAHIHPNTVRFYERLGLISPVPRSANGYRIFDDRHLVQVNVLRCIYLDEWPGEAIRKASLHIVEALKVWDLAAARRHAQSYQSTIAAEAEKARQAIEILSQWAAHTAILSESGRASGDPSTAPTALAADDPLTSPETTGETLRKIISPRQVLCPRDVKNPRDVLNRREAATLIGVTPEALRNWERNDLIQVPRSGQHQTRFYGQREIQRLQVIYLLRQARFSMSAIHRCLSKLDAGHPEEALNALKLPHAEAVWTGDRWLAVLEMFAAKADEIDDLLRSLHR